MNEDFNPYGDPFEDEHDRFERQLQEQAVENEALKAQLAAHEAGQAPAQGPEPSADITIGWDGNFVDKDGQTLEWEAIARYDVSGAPLNDKARDALKAKNPDYARVTAESDELDAEAVLDATLVLR